jgi:hypothetical protein
MLQSLECNVFLQLKFNVFVESLHEDLGKTWGLGPMLIVPWLEISVSHINYFHAKSPPTLIGLFGVDLDGFGVRDIYVHSSIVDRGALVKTSPVQVEGWVISVEAF